MTQGELAQRMTHEEFEEHYQFDLLEAEDVKNRRRVAELEERHRARFR